jgi:hypothetical protein
VQYAGISTGAGTSLLLAIQAFLAALFRSNKLSFVLAAPFAWVRLFDPILGVRESLDAAAGLYFYGTKRTDAITPRELVDFYQQQLSADLRRPPSTNASF